MPSQRTLPPHCQQGLTLVELMVALALSLMLMAGVAAMFEANKRTYRVQDAFSRLQENGRFALNTIVRDLRGAGYLGCSSLVPRPVFSSEGNSPAAANPYNPYTFNPYTIEQLRRPVSGVDNVSSVAINIPNTTVDDNLFGQSDLLEVTFTDGAGARVGDPSDPDIQHQSATADLPVTGYIGLAQNDFVVVSDCKELSVFQVTNDVQSSGVVSHGFSSGVGIGRVYRGGPETTPEIARLAHHTYFVADADPNDNLPPSLWRAVYDEPNLNIQEIVEGVEDLQVFYGLDDNLDNVRDRYVAQPNDDEWPNVVSVQVHLLLRSVSETPVTDTAQTVRRLPDDPTTDGTIDPVVETFNDGQIRQAFSATIAIRNSTL